MKKLLLLTISLTELWFFSNCKVNAQGVGINASGNQPDPSAILDLSSTTKGFVLPRMTTSQRNSISSPIEGLQIFNTTTKCFEFYASGVWQATACGCTSSPSAVTAIASPTILCAWNMLTLAGSATGATAWSWTGPNGFTSTLQSPTISNITTAGSGVYTLTVSNACGFASAVNTTSVMITTGCPCQGTPTVTDIDANTYNTVSIGSQCWMKENLKTTKYKDNSPIPNVSVNATWAGLTTGAYCDYNNSAGNSTTYGRLYNWYAITNASGICPTGWHIPTDAEWCALENTVEPGTDPGCNIAGWCGPNTGNKLREIGTVHWVNPNPATNTSGFSALPGGYRLNDGTFQQLTVQGMWWSASENSASNSWIRLLYYFNEAYRDSFNKKYGASVRCVRD